MEKLGVSTQLIAGGDIFPALELVLLMLQFQCQQI